MFYNFDWLIFHHFLQLIYRLTPLTSAAKSNENLVNQKLCNTVLILDALYVYSYLMAAKCWRVNLIFISPSKTQRIMYYFSSKYGPNVFKLIFKTGKIWHSQLTLELQSISWRLNGQKIVRIVRSLALFVTIQFLGNSSKADEDSRVSTQVRQIQCVS